MKHSSYSLGALITLCKLQANWADWGGSVECEYRKVLKYIIIKQYYLYDLQKKIERDLWILFVLKLSGTTYNICLIDHKWGTFRN